MARLVEGDPLALWARAARALSEAALLLDAESLFERSAARVVLCRSTLPTEERATSPWLEARVSEALRELLAAQRESEARSLPLSEMLDGSFYSTFAHALQCTAEEARYLCVLFNALPQARRQPFYHVVVQRRLLEEYAREARRPAREVYQAIDLVMSELAEAVEARNWHREPEQDGGQR